MATRKRGKGARAVVPDGISRNERRTEAGFVAYCKCPDGFLLQRPETLEAKPHLRGICRSCGSHRPEWRCPVHKLKAVPLVGAAEVKSAGCPRCGRGPREQRFDAYRTALART